MNTKKCTDTKTNTDRDRGQTDIAVTSNAAKSII